MTGDWIKLTLPIPLGTAFYLRTDIITEILPSEGETIVRTNVGGQHICSEDAATIMEHIGGLLLPPVSELA